MKKFLLFFIMLIVTYPFIYSDVGLSYIPCTNCKTCNVKCSMGFNIRDRILDIAKLQNIPEDFLV